MGVGRARDQLAHRTSPDTLERCPGIRRGGAGAKVENHLAHELVSDLHELDGDAQCLIDVPRSYAGAGKLAVGGICESIRGSHLPALFLADHEARVVVGRAANEVGIHGVAPEIHLGVAIAETQKVVGQHVEDGAEVCFVEPYLPTIRGRRASEGQIDAWRVVLIECGEQRIDSLSRDTACLGQRLADRSVALALGNDHISELIDDARVAGMEVDDEARFVVKEGCVVVSRFHGPIRQWDHGHSGQGRSEVRVEHDPSLMHRAGRCLGDLVAANPDVVGFVYQVRLHHVQSQILVREGRGDDRRTLGEVADFVGPVVVAEPAHSKLAALLGGIHQTTKCSHAFTCAEARLFARVFIVRRDVVQLVGVARRRPGEDRQVSLTAHADRECPRPGYCVDVGRAEDVLDEIDPVRSTLVPWEEQEESDRERREGSWGAGKGGDWFSVPILHCKKSPRDRAFRACSPAIVRSPTGCDALAARALSSARRW